MISGNWRSRLTLRCVSSSPETLELARALQDELEKLLQGAPTGCNAVRMRRRVEVKYRVLAVDDQPDNLLILEDCLGLDYDVKVFHRGHDLLEYFEQGGKADLVLLDIVMPMPDGYALCRWLKAGALTQDIPVVFLTRLDSCTDKPTPSRSVPRTLCTSRFPRRCCWRGYATTCC